MNALSRSATIGLLCLAGLVSPGCRTGGESSGDVLRRQNMELQKQVAQLQSDAGELRAKLAELTGGGSAGKSGEVAEALPRVASIQIDFLSGPVSDSSEPPTSDRMRRVVVYVKPLDGRGRFVQATGTLTAEVSRLTPVTAGAQAGTTQPATLLASRTLKPLELRDAYRTGMTGTYYAAGFEIPAAQLTPPGQLLLRAEFSDGVTGARFEASRIVPLR